jgi:hypothetical protein
MRSPVSPKLALALTVLSLAAPLHAQEAADPAAPAGDVSAKQLFEQARDAYKNGDYREAVDLFKRVYEVTRSPNAHLYLARAQRELGNLVEAYEQMSLTVSEASAKAATEEKYAETRDAAARELAELGGRVGIVSVLLTEQPEGAEVTVAGRPIGLERLGSPIPVMPGTVSIRATAPGVEPVFREVQVRAGESKAVAISLTPSSLRRPEETAPAASEPGAATAEPAPAAAPSTGLRTAGFVTAGVGVAGMITFAVAGSLASSNFSKLEDRCGSRRCTDPSLQSTVDSGRTYQTVANVGLVVGAVGILAGGTLIVLGWPSARETVGLRVDLGPRGGTLGYAGSF